MYTLGALKAEIKSEFGKSSPRLESQLTDKIDSRLREICSDFDYWFNRIDPGVAVPAAFPYVTPPSVFGAGRWVDQGWLLTEPGVEFYPISLASSGDPLAPSQWGDAEACRIHFVKRYSLEGAFQDDLQVAGANQFFSHPGNGSGYQVGVPSIATLHAGVDRKCYLRVTPTPQKEHLLAVSFQLGLPPWIGDGDSRWNWMSHYYPRVLLCLAGMAYASWFHEVTQMQFWRAELFGDSDDGKQRSDIQNTGLVGKIKRDTMRRDIQETDELPYYASTSEGIGRGGSRGRYPGDPYYIG